MLVLFLTSLLNLQYPVSVSTTNNEPVVASADPLEIGLNSVVSGNFQGPVGSESEILVFMLDHIMISPVTTITHVPRSVHPLLARVLSVELRKACSSVWGFVRLTMFAKAVLRSPPISQNIRRRFVMSSVVLDSLHLWSQPGGIRTLWYSLLNDLKVSKSARRSSDGSCRARALFWAREGRYSNALQSLSSQGVASHDNDSAYQEFLNRHPSSLCPEISEVSSKSMTVDESMVLKCLKAFPKGTSPGASKLRAQHLLDAITGTTTPAARDCLASLTCLMNYLLSGKAPSCLAPWLCGAPLTALLKRGVAFAQLLWVR